MAMGFPLTEARAGLPPGWEEQRFWTCVSEKIARRSLLASPDLLWLRLFVSWLWLAGAFDDLPQHELPNQAYHERTVFLEGEVARVQ